MPALDLYLLIGALLLLVSIFLTRFTAASGAPTMLLFLVVGMLAGAEGPGGIWFDDAEIAQSIGIVALAIILFSGGLDTRWREVRPVTGEAGVLATIGVAITAVAVGLFSSLTLQESLFYGLLLGAIISSTDAAAVFAILRTQKIRLKGRLRPLLELESGSNDPMAIFLTIAMVEVLLAGEAVWSDLLLLLSLQLGVGALLGIALGYLFAILINKSRFTFEGVYPVFTVAYAIFVYALTASLDGSGFLAVYIAGLIAGNHDFVHKRSLLRFFDGLAWMSQIVMFLTLGLLVFPSQLLPILWPALAISAFLIFIARPLGVFLSLLPFRVPIRESLFVSFVGLRGAVPIILATFPMLAGVEGSEKIFNIVFFIVLTSALVQGWNIPLVARLLKVIDLNAEDPLQTVKMSHPLGTDMDMLSLIVPYNAACDGQRVVDLRLPQGLLIISICRNDSYIVPTGGSEIKSGDTILLTVDKEHIDTVREIFTAANSCELPEKKSQAAP